MAKKVLTEKEAMRYAKDLKILMFDIEQVPLPEHIWRPGGGFKADLSLLLSVGFKQVGKSQGWVLHLGKDDLQNFVKLDRANKLEERHKVEKELVQESLEVIRSADIIVSWYGSKHDLPYLNAKALMHGLQPCLHTKHLDLYRYVKYKTSFSSNRLGNICKGLRLPEDKTKVSPNLWDRTRNGCYKSLQEIAEYNIQDVVALEEVYKRVFPLIVDHPHFKGYIGKDRHKSCPNPYCAKDENVICWGYRVTPKGKAQRYKCNSCAHVWE